MAEQKESRVPDIGDYTGIPVIELLVNVGDTVAKDQGLATLESDKATMEVPAEFAGVVKEIRVKLGDNVSQGSVIALIEPSADSAAQTPTVTSAQAALTTPAATTQVETDPGVEPVAVSSRPDNIAAQSMEAAGISLPGTPQPMPQRPEPPEHASGPRSHRRLGMSQSSFRRWTPGLQAAHFRRRDNTAACRRNNPACIQGIVS